MAGQRRGRRRIRLDRSAAEGPCPGPGPSPRRAVRRAGPAGGRAGHPARLPVAAAAAPGADAVRGPGGHRSRRVRPSRASGPRHAIGWARSDALNKLTWMVICKGGLVSDITVGRLPRADGRPAGAPLPGQRGQAVVLRAAQGHRRAARRRTGAVAGAADRRAPQRRADRRQVRHRVQARAGPAGGVLHRTRARPRPHLAAVTSPTPSAGCSGGTWRSTTPASTRCGWNPRSRRRGRNAWPTSGTPAAIRCGPG